MRTRGRKSEQARPAPPPDGAATDKPADDRGASTFLHELSNLVDGSLRSLRLARRDLATPGVEGHEGVISHALKRLDAAESALAHVTGLIHSLRDPHSSSSSQQSGQHSSPHATPSAGVVHRPRLSTFDPDRSIIEAITHAVDVLRPLGEERGVELTLRLEPSIASAPTLPIYAVVTNAVRNAIEAIGSVGRVTINAHTIPDPDRGAEGSRGALLVIEVLDDGPGPAPDALDHAFDFGFTTKPGSSGIGLSLVHDIVTQLGGTVALTARKPAAGRPGATLRVVIPFALALCPTSRSPGAAKA